MLPACRFMYASCGWAVGMCTEMKAVLSIEIRGTTSISSWLAMSSSSGGVTDCRRD